MLKATSARRRRPQVTCARYYRSDAYGKLLNNGTVRYDCGKWWRQAEYVRDAAPFHDLPLEWAFLGALHRSGRVSGPPCALA